MINHKRVRFNYGELSAVYSVRNAEVQVTRDEKDFLLFVVLPHLTLYI